jgi:erythromycin esterase-like protein
MGNKRELSEFYIRDSNGNLHLNVKSVLFGGYDPQETGRAIEELNTYYRDIIVGLIGQVIQKDEEISKLRGKQDRV